jgi:glycosyltransferase involved in cell wall biosynthesis
LPEAVEEFIAERDPVLFTYAFMREGFYLATLVAGLELLTLQKPNLGLVFVGALEDNEPAVKRRIFEQIGKAQLEQNLCYAGDLSREQFFKLMRQSKLYLRTPTTDGQCSSVFESLALRVPVVAAENNNRPPGVVTYVADDPHAMCQAVLQVLAQHQAYCERIVVPELRDTIGEETDVLIAAALGKPN